MKIRHSAVWIAVISGTTLVGCTAGGPTTGSLEPTSAVAQLDASVERIDYPIELYSLSLEELRIIERADNIRMQECLAEKGHTVDLLAYLPTGAPYVADRVYGAWSMENAQLRGYGIPTPETETFDLSTQGAEFNQDWDACGAALLSSANLGLEQDSITNRVRAEAAQAAYSNPGWNEAIEEWEKCLTDQGVELSEENPWTPDLSNVRGSKEDEIRMAVTDVACKEKTSLVQRLANLEASYQQTLITQYEAELVAGRESIDERVQAAREVIAAH